MLAFDIQLWSSPPRLLSLRIHPTQCLLDFLAHQQFFAWDEGAVRPIL